MKKPSQTSRIVSFLILCLSLAALPVMASSQTVSVTVDGTTYELETVSGTFNDNQTLLEAQPWFGNADLAESIVTIHRSSTGDHLYESYSAGPLDFAVSASDSTVGTVISVPGGVGTFDSARDFDGRYFIGSTSSVPEINAGALSQAFLIFFSVWLVMRNASFRLRKSGSRLQAPA